MQDIISINNISVSYKGTDAVNNISLNVKKGEFIGITGPNGGGKTTFFKAILGLLPLDSGEIKISGNSIKKGRNIIGYVPQTSVIDRDFPITALETVMSSLLGTGLHPFKRFKKEDKIKAISILQKMGLKDYINNPVSALSGGEFQKLLIARVLVSNPDILMLDEPISNIDSNSREEIYQILENLNKEGKTVLMITHDMQNIGRFSRIVSINRTVSYDGSPSDFVNIER